MYTIIGYNLDMIYVSLGPAALTIVNEGTKVHNPRHYTQCIYTTSTVLCLYVTYTYIHCIVATYAGECTGKYTEVWQTGLRVQL